MKLNKKEDTENRSWEVQYEIVKNIKILRVTKNNIKINFIHILNIIKKGLLHTLRKYSFS